VAPLSIRGGKKGDVNLAGMAPPERKFYGPGGRLSLEKVFAKQDLRSSHVRD